MNPNKNILGFDCEVVIISTIVSGLSNVDQYLDIIVAATARQWVKRWTNFASDDAAFIRAANPLYLPRH